MKKESLEFKKMKRVQRRHKKRIMQRFAELKAAFFILLSAVLTRRVKVANQLYGLADAALVAIATGYVSYINIAVAIFVTPFPALADVTTAISDLSTAITASQNKGKMEITDKNVKREALMNLLCDLGNYVEAVANDPANAATGPVEIIQMAGMRARVFSGRGKQIWDVMRGADAGSLLLTAVAVRGGFHEWQYTTTPSDNASWIDAQATTKAKTVITGLTSGDHVYCRHRVVTKSGTSDWEGHDPVVVG